MIPAARVQSAIEILDEILDGKAVEHALTNWARRSRFAGSKDRAAVRDYVFDAVRCLRSYSALGGAQSGRGLMIGHFRAQGVDPNAFFTGPPYGPEPLTEAEQASIGAPLAEAERLDIPDWLWPRFSASLGDAAAPVAHALQSRAPIHLRVNLAKCDRDQAIARLADDGIVAILHPASATALEVSSGNRKIRQSGAYLTGLVELQDAASQAVVDRLPLRDGLRVLDYCAGGGGKTLAMAARARMQLFAHDIAPQRLADLPDRANRAGAAVSLIDTKALASEGFFDLVLCDAPCSGSGSWRRAPEGKWSLTEARLIELMAIQYEILVKTADLVTPGGVLAYATCSVLQDENNAQIDRFLAEHSDWTCGLQSSWSVADGTDGFFTAHLTRR